ncbi:hypothetical protein GE061_016919 [Apolygus lucorum]|uniref:Uncharacterized protein n=1 Tax=Apolygus lucorum TaxID=248454 RepID=A0A6A4JAW2_APOLU|nr:hypothetical protein GE061_016919 [Apolygus lucorum]
MFLSYLPLDSFWHLRGLSLVISSSILIEWILATREEKMRNYKRETAYQPMTERQLITTRRLISEGLSIRKTALEIGFHESPLRAKLKNDQISERLGVAYLPIFPLT